MTASGQLWLRVSGLALVFVIVQATLISQISLLGASADLTPLIVMSAGLLAGSTTGAVTGFGLGLLVDLLLVQTLGISSLLYLVIGYWSGRLRELRDPSHGLVPLAVGAAAAAVATIGFAIIEFLLGVDAPVSLLLVRQILVTIVIDALLALPVYAFVRWVLRPCLPDQGAGRPRRGAVAARAAGALSPLTSSRRSSRRGGRRPALRALTRSSSR